MAIHDVQCPYCGLYVQITTPKGTEIVNKSRTKFGGRLAHIDGSIPVKRILHDYEECGNTFYVRWE